MWKALAVKFIKQRGLVFLALVCNVALLPVLGLWLAPWFLCVAAPPRKSDVIIMLGGEDGSRVEKVVTLFKAGWASHVIISGENEMYRQEMIDAGIPAVALLVEPDARNTAQNAKFSIRLMQSHGYKSALLVTSWYHTRRSFNCFLHFGIGLAFYSQPTYQSPAVAKVWGLPRSRILQEYPKNLWYMVRYGIFPF